MKLETKARHYKRNRSTVLLLFDLIVACHVLFGVIMITNCGGTFTLRPDGSLSYKTPEILKPKIVEPAK